MSSKVVCTRAGGAIDCPCGGEVDAPERQSACREQCCQKSRLHTTDTKRPVDHVVMNAGVRRGSETVKSISGLHGGRQGFFGFDGRTLAIARAVLTSFLSRDGSKGSNEWAHSAGLAASEPLHRTENGSRTDTASGRQSRPSPRRTAKWGASSERGRHADRSEPAERARGLPARGGGLTRPAPRG